jgi:hypothetical protein
MRFTSDTRQSKQLLKKKCTGRKRAGRVGACMRER